MSRRNREKRAAKQKDRRRATNERPRPRADTGSDRAHLHEQLIVALYQAATGPEHVVRQRARNLLDGHRRSVSDLDVAAGAAVAGAIRTAWEAGWSPGDLHEFARRKLQPVAAGYLAEAIIHESQRYGVATLHPRWRADLDEISVGVDVDPRVPQMWRWAASKAVDHVAALTVVVTVLRLLSTLPALEQLLPLPGERRHGLAAVGDVDQKALAKVRALLAKAESTNFPEEAEAFSAKAQELMSKYSLHQAITDHRRGQAPVVVGRRMWMSNPYAGAKAGLVHAVAAANRCRVVWTENPGFVTVVGVDTDLDFVEMLTTSLLVQANRAMLAAGRQAGSGGHTRTRSFRQSFLVAYGVRIGERLDTTNASVTVAVDDGRLLPVLAARSKAADEVFDRLFPSTVARPLSASNYAGAGAGRAAADLAVLDVRSAIAG